MQNTLIMIVIVRDVKRARRVCTIPKRSGLEFSGQCDEDAARAKCLLLPSSATVRMPKISESSFARSYLPVLSTLPDRLIWP